MTAADRIRITSQQATDALVFAITAGRSLWNRRPL
jgi:hypothetical protein